MQFVVHLRKVPISGSLTVIHMCINYISTGRVFACEHDIFMQRLENLKKMLSLVCLPMYYTLFNSF